MRGVGEPGPRVRGRQPPPVPLAQGRAVGVRDEADVAQAELPEAAGRQPRRVTVVAERHVQAGQHLGVVHVGGVGHLAQVAAGVHAPVVPVVHQQREPGPGQREPQVRGGARHAAVAAAAQADGRPRGGREHEPRAVGLGLVPPGQAPAAQQQRRLHPALATSRPQVDHERHRGRLRRHRQAVADEAVVREPLALEAQPGAGVDRVRREQRDGPHAVQHLESGQHGTDPASEGPVSPPRR